MTKENQVLVVRRNKIEEYLASDKTWISLLGDTICPKRFLRTMTTEMTRNPAILECTLESIRAYFMLCAELKLMPGSTHKAIYPVPFYNKHLKRADGLTKEVVPIPGYQGKIELAQRHPNVSKVVARVVCDVDTFDYAYGTDEYIIHKPQARQGIADTGNIVNAYAICFLKNGDKVFVVLQKGDIQESKRRSKAGEKKDSPWTNDYAAMAMKTAVHRLSPFMPRSVEYETLEQAEVDFETNKQYAVPIDVPEKQIESGVEGVKNALKDEPGEKRPTKKQKTINEINEVLKELPNDVKNKVVPPNQELAKYSQTVLDTVLETCNDELAKFKAEEKIDGETGEGAE